MNSQVSSKHNSDSRIGFHYYQDTMHYGEKDLAASLPFLKDMGASWVVLDAPVNRAIPEAFLVGLINAGIKPVLHFKLTLPEAPTAQQLTTLLRVYARWGVRQVIFFDRPNRRSSWNSRSWSQHNLVERFMDQFIPLANAAIECGLTPLFPPLEPGGDYWDTSFLRSSLESLMRRKQTAIMSMISLAALAWTGGRHLEWGKGGPACWPQAHPYNLPEGSEDHRGWHIYEWYQAIGRNVLGRDPEIILLQAGAASDPECGFTEDMARDGCQTIEQILPLLKSDPANPDALPSVVRACFFWLLTRPRIGQTDQQVFIPQDDSDLPCIAAIQDFARQQQSTVLQEPDSTWPIEHYLLLPNPTQPLPAWKMQLMQPYINKHHPTIGFSPEEAAFARRVTVFAGPAQISDEILEALRLSGSMVDRIETDGISIATEVFER